MDYAGGHREADLAGGIGTLTREALHYEFKELRASIRHDLQEELGRALASVGGAGSVGGIGPGVNSVDDRSQPHTSERASSRLRWAGDACDSREDAVSRVPSAISDLENIDISDQSADGKDLQPVAGLAVVKTRSLQRPIQAAQNNWTSQGTKCGEEEKGGRETGRQTSHKMFEPPKIQMSAVDKKNALGDADRPKKKLDIAHKFKEKSNLVKKALTQETISSMRTSSSSQLDAEGIRQPLRWDEVFEMISVCAIFLNGILCGVQTEMNAQRQTNEPPLFFFFMEIMFCFIFTTELLLKLAYKKRTFFNPPDREWNFFDALLVLLQLFDLLMEVTRLTTGGRSFQLSFLRLLRILRILRVVRLVRLLKFFGELNVVTSAIANSLKSLSGTILMLLLILYIVGIIFTGAATTHIVALREGGSNPDGTAAYQWWNTLGRSILSLYEAILGGADWDELVGGLLEINPFWACLFLLYIAFMMLTMLNVITGIFVESAVKHAQLEKEKVFATHMRHIFTLTDMNHDGRISREEFESEMSNASVVKYMIEIGIDPREARLLFDLMDLDESNSIEAEEFLAGMVRLRAGAKFIDMMNILHEVEKQRQLLWLMHGQLENAGGHTAPSAPVAGTTSKSLASEWC